MRTLIVLLLLAGTANADTHNELWTGSFTRALHTDSANALTGDSLGGGSWGYARELPLRTLPDLELWATGNLLWGTVDGQMFETLDTQIETLQFAAGVRARYPVWRFVSAVARVDVGTQREAVSIEDQMGNSASDSGWGAISTAALGVELMPLSLRRFGLGFRFELGYVAASSVAITAHRAGGPDDTIELDRMAASLGHLDISGRYASFVISARF